MTVNRKRLQYVNVALLSLLLLTPALGAKQILKGKELSENRVFIRTDGLACYFCAYGLERFFKKTRRIAAFDMDMKKGIVTATFVRGERLVPPEILSGFVHDAGFTARWIDAELVGTLEIAGDASVLRVRETDERIPLESTAALRGYLAAGAESGVAVRVIGRAEEDEDSPLRLVPASVAPASDTPTAGTPESAS